MKVSNSILPQIRRNLPFLGLIVLASCGIYETKNQDQNTLQAPNGLTLSQITPTTKLSYATVRALVIEANCKKCHIDQARAGVSLSDYASTKANLAGIETTVFNGGSSPMPPAPAMMPELAKSALRQWISQGAPEFAGDDTRVGTPSPTPANTPQPILVVSYAQVSAQVFSVSCKKCHMDGNAKGKVALDTYDEVIANLPAIESTVFKGVPKLMPRNGLPADQKLLLQTWIDLGAKEGVVVVPTPTPGATPNPSVSPAPSANPKPVLELTPTFASLKSAVFDSKCLKCHAAGARVDDLPLDNYATMIAALGFVVPGNITGSSLVKAIESGSMPPKRANLPAVTPEELAVIKTWITNGAPQ